MSKWFSLLQNEWLKLMKTKSTWVMVGILVISVFITGGVMKWEASQQSGQLTWEQTVKQEVEGYQQMLNNEQLPSDQRAYTKDEIKMLQYRLDNNIPPAQKGTFWSFVRSSKNLLSVVTMFTVIVASGIVATEFSKGTIKLLLIRPISRGKILYSKYAMTLIFAFFLSIILLVSAMIAGLLFFPLEEAVYLTVVNGEVVHHSMPWEIGRSFLYGGMDVLMMATLAFMISTVFRSNALAIGLTLFLMFTGKQVIYLLHSYQWVKYILFTHTDFTQFLQPQPMVEGLTPLYSLGIIAIYFIGFHLISYFTFTKRDVAV